ncbi:AAA-ATPase [Quillaja saponaria]|uniref:AAA-ATPase n=1 Tax=Quillaja saponaria TaxID=32244 RepID=A0AAD7PD61_QUISA|nr:AAA-ATPase [Quillaja saponaria]
MRPSLSLQRFTSSFSNIQSASSWFEVYAAFSTSMILLRTAVNDFLPPAIRSFIISNIKSLFFHRPGQFSQIISLQINGYWEVGQKNELYEAVKDYMPAKICHEYNTLRIGKLQGKENIAFAVTSGQKFEDAFEDMKVTWTFNSVTSQENVKTIGNIYGNNYEKNMFVLSFDEKHRDKVLESSIPYVLNTYKAMKEGEKVLKIHTRTGGAWTPSELRHPSTFEKLAMDPELKQAIIDDLNRFLRRKEFYKRVGKAWKRGYLIYGPPGTGKSSLMAAMVNYLNFDVYDLQLSHVQSCLDLEIAVRTTTNRSILVIEDIDCIEETHDRSKLQLISQPSYYKLSSIGCDSQLMSAVRTTSNRSILVIEDIDCNEETQKRSTQVEDQMLQFSKKSVKFTLSGLLNYIDGLWSSCGEERIIIFTTNHIDKLDPALIRPGRMDMHINLSYCKAQGFKTLASNYLGIHGSHDHPLVKEIEGLLEKTEVTPAVVAEELMKNENADISLGGLVNFLKRKKMAGEHDMKVVGEGQEGKGDDLQVKEDANLPKSKRPKIVE